MLEGDIPHRQEVIDFIWAYVTAAGIAGEAKDTRTP